MGAGFEAGSPRLADLDERFRVLFAAQPEFIEFNRVDAGYCTRPQGPAACPEFLACAEATHDGCAWFATDPADPDCLIELDERVCARHQAVDQARVSGQVVLSGKLAVLAERAERMRDQAMDRAPAEAIARLREHLARAKGSES